MPKTANKIPVVVFNDNISAYGICRSLAVKKIPLYLVSKESSNLYSYADFSKHSRYFKKTTILHPGDPHFLKKLKEWVRINVGCMAVLMVAGDDDYLDVLSKNHSLLHPNLIPTFPDWTVVKRVRKKNITYSISKNIGVPIPTTYEVFNMLQLETLIKNDISYPLLMKSEASELFLRQYNTKGIICNNANDVLENYKKYSFGDKLVIQSMIPGGEENLFCLKTILNKNSEPVAVFVDKKIRSTSMFLSCTLTASTWADEVVFYGLKLLKEIGYYGYASVEFKYDSRDNTFKLMEINGRVSKNHSNALAAGINLIELLYNEAVNCPLPPLKQFARNYKNDVFWWYPSGDLGSVLNMIKNKEFSFVNYLRGFIGAKKIIIEPFYWKDPIPSLVNFFKTVVFGFREVFKRNAKKQ